MLEVNKDNGLKQLSKEHLTIEPLNEQQQAIVDMVRIIHKKGLDKELDIATNTNFVRYFLKSKEWDIGEAIELLHSYIKWRNDQFSGPVPFESIHRELATKKLLVLPHDTDNAGNLLCFFASGKHFPANSTIEDFIKTIIFVMETFLCANQEYKGYTVINDMTDVRWANFDLKVLTAMRGLQYCFPLMPHKVLIYNPPYIFKMVWGLAKPLLYHPSLSDLFDRLKLFKPGIYPNVSRDTPPQPIHTINSFENAIDVDQEHLPTEYGGTLQVNCTEWLKDLKDLSTQHLIASTRN